MGKTTGKITMIIAAFIIVVCMANTYPSSKNIAIEIDQYYTKQLQQLKNDISIFIHSVNQKKSLPQLKNEFYRNRLTYKKLAVLTDYFNQYETKSLNGPPLNRIESEVADRIISPQGFQAIEELLFDDNGKEIDFQKIKQLLDGIQLILLRLEKEPDRKYKFKEELVWDAIRSATVGIITTGITGFDSPAANNSIPEAIASFDGIQNLLILLKPAIDKVDSLLFPVLISYSERPVIYLKNHKNFNSFDRLTFIKDYCNPFYQKLIETRIKTGVAVPEGRSSINYLALSIFDEDALNINFYSPPEEYWLTDKRIQLGKLLFSDPILSGNHNRSCASCHQPDKGFTDGLAKPLALDNKTVLPRNTPTLWNSGYQTKQFFDSRSDILENQLTEVVHNEEEMKGSMKQSVIDLKKSSLYSALFKEAYAKEKEPVNTFTIANAIASYVRSLRSLNSRFDQYMRGDKTKMTKKEKKGFNLFAGKAKCATCHFIPLFNGVVPPFYAETESEVLGVPKSKNKNPAIIDDDLGKFLFTGSIIHKYAFKTPTLRNIELTAPYMHNGVYNTLEEVMEFYNNGGGRGLKIGPENQTLPFDKLNLSKKEMAAIISFMNTLTDTTSVRYH